ncbi:N-acetyl-gamma-glutamyl-phosphate reductase [Falsochrobactrum ovis]|uniref:N-acetyl-gamma-glutamyl-phosphate reductase n=1 Tax=Falsochrobactrum ovis TaxID=1293442 RepID=A0A364JVF6_9HYPH|nr:N-acetyl-gamma-glutamyl-phosphate reductase [Falsochrobactrum ovis]RAK29096.1 N-acetyl-gamma-glutamyl-phosphate reductase [Falsochrobactrum ovis]
MKQKIFIDGEHGTTGLQIRRRLAERDDLEVISIPEAERRNKDLRADYLRAADIAILCLPDDASREAVALLEGHESTRIIDTSTAHRVQDGWVYGFAELDKAQRQKIAEARLVANPGCYPTGAIALIRPLRDAGLLPADYPISVNAVSGYTGGGKQLIAQMEDKDHPEHLATSNFLYGLALRHKHLAELKLHGRLERRPLFSPSVGRFAQGMIVQVPLFFTELNGSPSLSTIHSTLTEHYSDQDIVEVVALEESKNLARVEAEELAGKDGMKLFVFGTEGDDQVNLVALLDNLGKGASGAAVQNMDLMLGK